MNLALFVNVSKSVSAPFRLCEHDLIPGKGTSQSVHETDQIRPAGIKIAGDRHLADQQKIVRLRIFPIDDPHPLRLLPTAFAIRN